MKASEMKFPIGTRFSYEPFHYELVGYDGDSIKFYYVKLWDDDIRDHEIIEMTEPEVERSIARSKKSI